MQRPDPRKRAKITAAAARLFAREPYHEVTLDAVAAAAAVGKGTLYVYFRGKDELYAALIEDGFARLLDDLRTELGAARRAADALAAVLRALFQFARRFPHLFHLMRSGQQLPGGGSLQPLRAQLTTLIEKTLRAAVRRGELADRSPGLTALYLPSLVRAVVLYGPDDCTDARATAHVLTTLLDGLRPRRGRPRIRR